MKDNSTFDYELTHDTGRQKFDPQRNQRNYKIESIGEVVEDRGKSKWIKWLAGSLYSQHLELTDDDGIAISPLTIKARSKDNLRSIVKAIVDIAKKEATAQKILSGKIKGVTSYELVAGALLYARTQEIRYTMLKKWKIQLPT